jgi:hypothetical protein
MGLRKRNSLANRINHIITNMTTSGKLVIGDDHRTGESHRQFRHSTPTMHSPRPSMLRSQSGNRIFLITTKTDFCFFSK